MKIVFSRKGFDSSAGRAPSPIINGRPISLPIPTQRRSNTTYEDLGLGHIVEATTKKRIAGSSLCHHDPMFENTRCAFGQTAASQAHLENNGVGVGDVFLFFGLFSDLDGRDRHHRLFGFMFVENVIKLGSRPSADDQPIGFSRRHPHTIGDWNANNTLYIGEGQVTHSAHDDLRLSQRPGPVGHWKVPNWLSETGLTYHRRKERWGTPGTLSVAARGQEFVCDIGNRTDAGVWLNHTLTTLCGYQIKVADHHG